MATEDKDLEKTIAEDLVVTKYKLAGEIVNSKCSVVEPFIILMSSQIDIL